MGRADHVRSDAHHPVIFIEAKNKKVYAAVVDALTDVRKEAKKTDRAGVLMFLGDPKQPPREPLLAIHSSDLIRVGMWAWKDIIESPFHLIRGCHASVCTSIRKDFKDWDDANELAKQEGRPITVLAFKKPNSAGFVLVLKTRSLIDVMCWHIAGQLLINEVAKAAGRDDQYADLSQYETYYVDRSMPGLDAWVASHLGALRDFGHHWQPPKKKRKSGNERQTDETNTG